MKTTCKSILKANRYGLQHPDWSACWHTPVNQKAYELGCKGIDLNLQPVVSFWRRGAIPEGGVSYNYRDEYNEGGLSVMAVNDNDAHYASEMWMSDRERVTGQGILLEDTGSDGEPLVLPFGVPDYD